MNLHKLHILSLYYQGIEPHEIAINLKTDTDEIYKTIRNSKTMSLVYFSEFSKQRYAENARFCASISPERA